MNYKYIYALFIILMICSGFVFNTYESPESQIVGQWQEIGWKYEKVDKPNGVDLVIDNEQKQEICKNLVIHKAETWSFDKNRKLTLQGDFIENLDWTIKGRGHILELKHADKRIEDYQIQEITEDKMIVHFNFDLQVRGIVKMTFQRIK